MTFNAVSASRKQDQVVHGLRQAILSGELRPGERVLESRLAQEFDVSLTPVREALAELAGEGLVVKLAHRGTFVSRLSARELQELLLLRSVLDPLSARLAAERATDDVVDVLRTLVERMREAEKAKDLPALTEAHLELHEALYELSGSALLMEIFGLLHRRMTLALAFAENLFRSAAQEAECHVPLIDALADRDPERAAQIASELATGWLDQLVIDDGRRDRSSQPTTRRRR